MILLVGDPPKEPMIVVSLIQPDGAVRYVSFLAERVSLLPISELFAPVVAELLREPSHA
jgi:hypothetical protein